jgi:S1/P1 Nuclease
MTHRCLPLAVALALLCSPPDASAWNTTGHHMVGRIAWDHLTPAARLAVVERLLQAPRDSCLLDLFSNDTSRPPGERQREFFMAAATWPDIVRPRGDADSRACTRFHRRDWHFVNYFWEGVSGATNGTRPRDRGDLVTPELNAPERLRILRPFAACATQACGTTAADRATSLAWILHLVGDIHQPLHTTARVTTRADEQAGDRGGNLFRLESSAMPLSLHAYWDEIIDRAVPRQASEQGDDRAYVARVAAMVVATHPRASMVTRLTPGDFEAWAREGLAITKRHVYPATLRRGQMPSAAYRANAAKIAFEAIALGAYRLADLLNQMFG